jgi:hypothetical protein
MYDLLLNFHSTHAPVAVPTGYIAIHAQLHAFDV